jgi:enoyl-CoA hydratase/carnithine racemase
LNEAERIMSEHVLVNENGAVTEIRINRAEKKNAITNAMYGAMADALERAQASSTIRVVVIGGTGDAFTAGNDLADFAAVGTGALAPADMQVTRMLGLLTRMTKPLIAAVNGPAVGIGTTLLLHCDLVFLSETARLSTPFVNLALVPEAASSLLLPARIGHARAFAMFALGEPIDAPTAVAMGLANRVCPPAELDATARKAALALAARAPNALAHTKALMRDPELLATIMQREGARFNAQLRSPEAREAFQAFFERRAPDFSKLQ